jgi:streptomycin 6-kinase
MAGSNQSLPLPRNRVEAARQEGRTAWLATLPDVVARLSRSWSLTLGEPFQPGGQTAWVAPVRDASGANRVLKVGWRHPEAIHEAVGLNTWAGDGSVYVYASEELDDTTGLLLERCRPGTPLADRPEAQQDHVVAGLLRRLWRAPYQGRGFRPLQVMCDAWADEFEAAGDRGPDWMDPGLVRDGIALFRSLPATADRQVLLCTDLHADNVLSAEREPWLVIDPKPYVGDPTYDPLQHMLNCADRLHTDPRGLAGRMADVLDLDRERLLRWLFARCVQESTDDPSLLEVARRVGSG